MQILGLAFVVVSPAVVFLLWVCMAAADNADVDYAIVRSEMQKKCRSCRACVKAEHPCSGNPYECWEYELREVY